MQVAFDAESACTAMQFTAVNYIEGLNKIDVSYIDEDVAFC